MYKDKNKNLKTSWEIIKDFYESELGIPGYVVEYLAVIDIVLLSSYGISNKNISKQLEISEEDVFQTCDEFLGNSFRHDINFSPMYIYCVCGGHFKVFSDVLRSRGFGSISAILFNVCEKVLEMERKIDEYFN